MALLDRATVVSIHLERLAEIVARDEPRPADAIYASIALRCLSEDSLLGRTGRDYDIPITINAPDLTGVPYDQALVFVCGGYRHGHARIKPFYMYREPGLKSMHRVQFERQVTASPSEPKLHEVKLGRFLSSPSMAFVGQSISRETVFRYVANKCGGAHHHDNIEGFNELERTVTNLGEMVHLSGSGLSMVFSETIGTAWFILNSPSVQALRSKLSNTGSAEVIQFLSPKTNEA